MPPIVALGIGLAFVAWLLKREAALRGKMPRGLWVPFLWLLIQGSRPVTSWFGVGGTELGGNPIEAAIAFGLFFAAFVVLSRRGFQPSSIPLLNVALAALFAYFLLSCVWAPYSFVALKRWSKEVGALLIALVILTEDDPAGVLKMLGLRCGQILFPLSIVLYKYFPKFGRDFSMAGGEMITGVTPQKNALGTICAVFGLIIVWDIIDGKKAARAGEAAQALWPKWLTLLLGIWLLVASESKTSFVAFCAGLVILLATQAPAVRRVPSFFAKLCFIASVVGLIIAAFWTTHIAPLLEAMGRDATFTYRTNIWSVVLQQPVNSIVGSGFYSFWLGPGAGLVGAFGGVTLTSAHSGYLETYLDGGVVGCALLGLFIITTCLRLAGQFSHESSFSRMLFALAIMCAIMNFSETYYLRLGIIWFMFEVAALAPRAALEPARAQAPAQPELQPATA